MKRLAFTLLLVLVLSPACKPTAPDNGNAATTQAAATATPATPAGSLTPHEQTTGFPVVWGMPVNGMSANITMDKKSFTLQEPLTVRFRLRNMGGDPVQVITGDFWTNHHITLQKQDGAPVNVTSPGMSRLEAFAPQAAPPAPQTYELAGQTIGAFSEAIDIREIFIIDQPGAYRMQMLFQASPGGWQGLLHSNPFTFTVSP